jgi:formylglycine-generating enzyme required for sulfatase activity
VTTITWLDAVLWCNALSELEGLEPAYYVDAEFTTPLRVGIDRRTWETRDDRPVVHWKSGAAGYRLPTPGEWRALAAGASPDPAEAWTATNAQNKTQPVGQRNPAPSGLHDLFGNVAEWVWTPSGPVMDPAVVDRVGAFGGSYLDSEDENAFSPIPFGHVPWNGDPAIGFRVVRNGAGDLADPGQEVPFRVVTRKQIIPPRQPPTGDQLRAWLETRLRTVQIGDAGQLDAGSTETSLKKTSDRYPLLAFTTEMPYEVWIRVKQWSEIEKGYRYNFSGDMGSARRNISLSRGPREPVTQVSWFDAVVWCNALSELYGLEPVYLNEEGEVEREASPFRLTTYAEYHYPNEGRYEQRPIDTAMVFDFLPDPKRNGYRLPTVVEMRSIGMTERDGPLNKTGTVDTGWFMENSGGKAHPVGTKTANAQGIHDALGNVQEWTYGGSGLFGQNRYGNDFVFASDNYPHTMNRQDHVSSARAYLGFRPVRRAEVVLP